MRDELSVLSAFLAVADERSFTKAAKRLNISTSGLSHAIRRLEEQIGVRLLTRTTRSVSPTDAGEQLLAQLRPALSDIRGVLTTLSGLQSTADGPDPTLVSAAGGEDCRRAEARTVRARLSGRRLDITTDDSRVDLVAAGTTPASTSGSTSRKTWSPFACRPISGPPSSPRPPTSSHTLGRRLRETC